MGRKKRSGRSAKKGSTRVGGLIVTRFSTRLSGIVANAFSTSSNFCFVMLAFVNSLSANLNLRSKRITENKIINEKTNNTKTKIKWKSLKALIFGKMDNLDNLSNVVVVKVVVEVEIVVLNVEDEIVVVVIGIVVVIKAVFIDASKSEMSSKILAEVSSTILTEVSAKRNNNS